MEMETNNIEDIIMLSKKMLVDEYRHPKTRGWHWEMMKGWLVDDEGELTRRGREIITEVDAWEAEHDSSEEKDQDKEA